MNKLQIENNTTDNANAILTLKYLLTKLLICTHYKSLILKWKRIENVRFVKIFKKMKPSITALNEIAHLHALTTTHNEMQTIKLHYIK